MIKAGARSDEMDGRIHWIPNEALGAMALSYQQRREQKTPCLWKGDDNLRAAAHLIHEKIEVRAAVFCLAVGG